MGCGTSHITEAVPGTVLVTGGTGLVGCALREVARDHPHFNFVFVGSEPFDLTKREKVTALFEEVQPEYVIHLAARVGGLFKNMQEPVDMLEHNLSINQNVVTACHKFKVKKLIACLSTCVFPDGAKTPLTESSLHTGPPHYSNAAYAHAKRVLDVHCEAYRTQYSSPFMCVIPTNVYGPHDQFDLRAAHVIPALIHRCVVAKRDKTQLLVRGTGAALRQFVYAKDFARRIVWLLTNGSPHMMPRAIVASEEEITIREVVAHIVLAVGFTGQVCWDFDPDANGQLVKTADGSLLQKACGLSWTPFRQGLQETVAWFLAELEAGRWVRGVP